MLDTSKLVNWQKGIVIGRKGYSEEFKQETVRQVTERGYSIKDGSENLGVSIKTLQRWVQLSDGSPSRVESKPVDKDLEILKLKSELKRVQEERDILKKAAVFFANNPE